MHAIAHVLLFYVDHLATSIAFYRDALDFEVARIQPAEEQAASAGLVNGDARLVLHERGWHDELQRGERTADAADRVHGEAKDNVLMLFVDDPEAVRRDLEERGYFEAEIEPEGTSEFYLADPDGNEIHVLATSYLAFDFGDG